MTDSAENPIAPIAPQNQPNQPAQPILDADNAKKVLQADLKNLLLRVQAGKPLSASQRQMIASLATGGDATAPLKAKSISELARILGVHRHTAGKLLKRTDCPVKQQANGEIDVTPFRIWAESNTLLKPNQSQEVDSKTQLESRRLELQNALLELDLEIKRGDFIAVAEVKRDAASVGFRIKTQLLGLPDALAQSLIGLDAVLIAQKLRDAITDALRHLAESKHGEK